MEELNIRQIGVIINDGRKPYIKIEKKYISGLIGLKDFSHINVVWCFNKSQNNIFINNMVLEKPYKNGPEIMGLFATRSPERPNPIALSTVSVKKIDYDKGIIELYWIDAFTETPVLDIKPYEPSCDRVEKPRVPEWCKHWPKSIEESADFDWENEFNF